MKRARIILLAIAALAVMACAVTSGGTDGANPKLPTDRVLTLKVTTSPDIELIEVVITANYGPELTILPADDGTPLDGYAPPPPLVTPWGYEFRLNATTPGPLHASVRIKIRRTVKVTCKWYIGQGSAIPVWTDSGYGETVCQFQMP